MLGSAQLDTSVKPSLSSGAVYVTNQRVVFVADVATPAAASTGAPDELRTLSVPLGLWQDGRLAQPLFQAIYYEAHVRPVADGGLSTPQLVKLYFKEGRSYEFVQAIDEVKARHAEQRGAAQRAAAGEDLPTYTPSSGASVPHYTASSSAPQPQTSQPIDASLMAAAEVARHAEDRERMTPSRGDPDNLPPRYEA